MEMTIGATVFKIICLVGIGVIVTALLSHI